MSFHRETTDAEFRDLPTRDYHRLTLAMREYARETRSGYVVKSYGEGLMMLKDASQGQGRALFFTIRRDEGGAERLTLLLVYKKESQEAPKRVLDTARQRMRDSQ